MRKGELREAGMVDMTPLFIHFAGMLNPKVDPFMTAMSLNKQGYFESLTDELIPAEKCGDLIMW